MTWHGNKIEGLNLRPMKNRKYIVFFILFGSLLLRKEGAHAAPSHENLAIQELRLGVDQMSYRVNSHQVEIDLIHERMRTLEASFEKLKAGLTSTKQNQSFEERLSKVEKMQELLLADLKMLKTHQNETSTVMTTCQTKITALEKQLTSDIQSLKASLQSMIGLLQGESATSTYTVRPGDSLGQIAHDHKIDMATLKKLNNLSTDMIYPGQKLRVSK